MRDRFTIEIASVPDRDDVVGELWLGDRQVAELSRDSGLLRLQIYPAPDGVWEFDFESFHSALATLMERLIGTH